ncbi:MAG: winged helix-turn-helix transcriptional regulator [Ardenticatenaceae bacterium]|nr:winged helix-turn-helix transcriptional regulator [Ardenticatenaceae bacterium]
MDGELRALAESQAAICSVFANPRRVLIIWTLAEQEKSVSEIAATVGLSLQNTSQHLHLMKEKGVLDSRRDAQTIYYRIAENELAKSCPLLIRAHQAKATI